MTLFNNSFGFLFTILSYVAYTHLDHYHRPDRSFPRFPERNHLDY